MKVFLLGSVVSPEEVDRIFKKSKIRPSVAPVYFQHSLISGLKDNGLDVTVYSLPPIKSFPNGSRFCWGKRKERLDDGTEVTWLPTINVVGLKQVSAYLSAKHALKKWLKENRNEKEKVVLCYYLYPPMAKAAVRLCKKFNVKSCVVVTELIYFKNTSTQKKIKDFFVDKMLKDMSHLVDLFDGYVFLTKYMVEKYHAEKKPFTIVEGLSNPNLFDGIVIEKKENAVTYTGGLSKSFGIDKLVKAFHKTKGDYKLYIYGMGECAELIKEYAKKDDRIVFKGSVERQQLLVPQVSSKILVNVKPSNEEYTKYTFPSKMMEYMLSGTPVLTTKLQGIPDDYFNYCYSIEDESVEGIKTAIENVLAKPSEELEMMGEKARRFVIEKKNKTVQCAKIKELLEKIMKEDESL